MPPRALTVWINDTLSGEITLTSDPRSFELPISEMLTGERGLEIELRPSDYRSPSELGLSEDPWRLGAAMVELGIEP